MGNDANVLFLSAGDEFQGSLYYTNYKGDASVQFLNLMRPDAMALGDHEFDNGVETLSRYIDKAMFPVICGNISTIHEPLLSNRLSGYVIVEKGGEKIGIVSVVTKKTKEISSPGDKIEFMDPVDYLKSAIPEIESHGVNKIIAITHVGLAGDKRIASNVTGVDAIIGGHSHTLLSNGEEEAVDVYPVMVKNPDGIEVPIVQAGAYSKYLGELSIRFDNKGVVTAAFGEPHLLDASVKADAPFAAMVASLGKPIAELKNKQVSSATATIDGDRDICRLGECSMGNLVADAVLERVKPQGVTIAFINGGSLRASIDAGEITMGEVIEVLPFQNTLATFQISGVDIIASLENGVSQTDEVAGRFPQVAGLRFSWDENVEPYKGRISQVQVRTNDKWTDIEPAKLYQVASNDFMRNGGDGYKLFKENGTNAYDFGRGLEQVLADYLSKNSPYTPYTDGRILKGALFEISKIEMVDKAKPATVEEAEIEKTEAPKVGAREYIIQKDDTLWKIAKAQYGDALMWKKIEAANGVQKIRNLKIGDKIILP